MRQQGEHEPGAQYETEKILAELPDPISDVIKPFARQTPDVGRTKELIIRSGFNVYPPEVEAVLKEHPAVIQSAVIGRSVPGNEEVVAYVELLPGSAATPADLMAHAARRLTPYKRPSEIIVLDALPAGSTGKILKHQLAAAARDRATAKA